MGKKPRLRLGKRKIFRQEGWISAHVQPSGKFWKRIANKAARRCQHLSSGSSYKKTFGHFEWS